MRDLLRAPCRRPPSVLAIGPVQPLPRRWRRTRRRSCRLGGRRCRRAGPARTHAASGSSPASLPSGASLRSRPSTARSWPDTRVRASRGRVTATPARDCRGITPDPASDLSWAVALRPQDRDHLPLDERQIPARRLGQSHRRHAATLTEPATPDDLGHADGLRSLDRPQTLSDPSPELALTPGGRGRPHLPGHRLFGRCARSAACCRLATEHLRVEVLRRPVECALAAPVGVADRAFGSAERDGVADRRGGQRGLHARVDGVAHVLVGEHVLDRTQVPLPRTRGMLADVAQPDLVRDGPR